MFSREMVQTSRNKNFQDINDRRWPKWFLFTFYGDLVHTTTKPLDTYLDDLKIDKPGHVILVCFLNPIMDTFINFNNDVFASTGFAIRDKMAFQLKKEGKVTVFDKGCLHLTSYEAPRAILITLTALSIFGKMGRVHLSGVEFIGEDSHILDCLRDIRCKLGELKVFEVKDCGYSTRKRDRVSFRSETYRITLSKDKSLKMEEDAVSTVLRSNVRIDQDETKETPFNFSPNNSFVLENYSNSNNFAHIILNELDSSVLSDANNISNKCPVVPKKVPDNPRRTKVLKCVRNLKRAQSDEIYFLSREPCNPQYSTFTGGTELMEKDLEVQNSDEDFHSSQESVLVTESSPPRAESSDTGETGVVHLSPKVCMTVPDERPEQTTSCQVPEPSGLYSKHPLAVVEEKILPVAYGKFPEMLYAPVRERQPQPTPAEDSSLPLTREGARQNTTPPHDEDTSLPLTGDRILQNMKKIAWRLASMQHLQSLPVRHQDLADAGWFYDEDKDHFRCYCCPAARARGLWTRGDNPEYLHQQMSPGCPDFGLHHSEVVDCEADTMVTECEAVSDDGNEVSREENTDNCSIRPETELISAPLYPGTSLAVGKANFQLQCSAELTYQINPFSQLDYSKPDLSEHAVDGAQDAISQSEAVHCSSNYSSGQRGETGGSDSLLENEACDLAEDGENFPGTECLSCSGTSQREDSVDWVRGRRDPSHSVSRSNSHEDDCGEAMTTTSDLDVREREEMISRLRTRGSDAFLAAHDVSLSEQDSQIASNLGQVEEAPSGSTTSPTFSQDNCRAFLSDGTSSHGRDTTGLSITGHADSEISNLYLSQYNGLTGDRESGNSSLSLQPVVTLSASPVDVRHDGTYLCDFSTNDDEDERAPHLPVPSPRDLAGDHPDTTTTDETGSPYTSRGYWDT